MPIDIAPLTLAYLIAEAQAVYPNECCGILLGQGGTIMRAQPAANVHPQPLSHFEIDPETLIAVHKAERAGGLSVLGYYHSHPNGLAAPSKTDAQMASGNATIWAIIAGETVTFWHDLPEGFQPLSHIVHSD